MKKILFLLPLLFLVIFPKALVYADDSSMSATVTPAMMATTNYTLPYPGILPDNPLYIFKVVRDNIVTFFISDPSRKSAFYLLQSDKRIAASWYLLKEGNSKDSLALTTLSKSTNYMSQAIDELSSAKASGESINAEKDSITNALVKHIAVVESMLMTQGLTSKNGFTQELQRLKDLQKGVSAISTQ